jgi:hypothetical protein
VEHRLISEKDFPGAGGVVQVVEHLASKHEALSSHLYRYMKRTFQEAPEQLKHKLDCLQNSGCKLTYSEEDLETLMISHSLLRERREKVLWET